jgi:L-seryl-tRNA(Ser) seleniumtransferase
MKKASRMAKTHAELFRELPAVDELLRHPEIVVLAEQAGQPAVTDACRAVLGRLREEIASGKLDPARLGLTLERLPAAVGSELGRLLGYSLRPVINATGVVLHTNLGRAPLAQAALKRISETAGTYSNLEFDLSAGERGSRDLHLDRLFRKLLAPALPRRSKNAAPSPAERDERHQEAASAGESISTIVVNNNAAAVLLALNTLAEGGEVIVSRGELVEIGGSFRIPEVMAKSGAVLKEVGTTNRTGIADYERAVNERTRLLLRVHRSNFEITGFTEQPGLAALVRLAEKLKLPLMEDLGSGALFDMARVGIGNEPGILDSLRSGVHLVTYSGDKLLGGPQAGIVSGRDDLVRKMRRNSLFRALRVDKLTYAALEATLIAYAQQEYETIPVVRMIELTKAEIAFRAETLVSRIGSQNVHLELIDGESLIGGGSAPSTVLPTTLVALTCSGLTAGEAAARLRLSDPPVIARLDEGRVLLDLRAVFPEQDEVLADILGRL